jgi:type I restriction enzyme S subunit
MSEPVTGWQDLPLGELVIECNDRVGPAAKPTVLSSTKHYGLVPSEEYFKGRTIYSENLSNYKRVERNWFAYATNHLPEGSIGIQEGLNLACVSPIYTVFRCRDTVLPSFLYRVLKSPALMHQYSLHERASVDRRGAVRFRDFAKIRARIPKSLAEQRRIAEILDAVDKQISTEESKISKRKRIFTGLSRAIANGRASQSSWKLTTVADILTETVGGFVQTGPFGSQLHASEYVLDGIPVVMPQNIVNGVVSNENIAKISHIKALALSRHRMKMGDVIIGRRGDLGRAALISADKVGWLCGTGCLLIRVTGGPVNPEWLAHIYRDDICQRQIAAMAIGSTMPNLNSNIVTRLRIPVPGIDEQEAIVSLLREYNEMLIEHREHVSKLHLIKQGLIDDLLTGRVRVPL